jgi:hypothetical protein
MERIKKLVKDHILVKEAGYYAVGVIVGGLVVHYRNRGMYSEDALVEICNDTVADILRDNGLELVEMLKIVPIDPK